MLIKLIMKNLWKNIPTLLQNFIVVLFVFGVKKMIIFEKDLLKKHFRENQFSLVRDFFMLETFRHSSDEMNTAYQNFLISHGDIVKKIREVFYY